MYLFVSQIATLLCFLEYWPSLPTRRLPLLFGLFSYDELRLYAIVLVCILVNVMSSFPL